MSRTFTLSSLFGIDRPVLGGMLLPPLLGAPRSTMSVFEIADRVVEEALAFQAAGVRGLTLENVGGDHLEAAISSLREFGRIAWVGAVAQYNSLQSPPPAPRNLYDVVGKSLRLEGVLVRNYRDVQGELEDFLVPHIRAGHVRPTETVIDGFDNIVDAFLGMLRGENVGKMLVRA